MILWGALFRTHLVDSKSDVGVCIMLLATLLFTPQGAAILKNLECLSGQVTFGHDCGVVSLVSGKYHWSSVM